MTRRGFTLLEVLLVLSILVTLFGIVWSVMFVFAQMETRRIQDAKQQWVILTWKNMLNDDFRTAIQDTEQLNKAEGSETIRHFGVIGTSTQLQIDITDYSPLTAESSELRTIFYEFQTIGLVRRERDYTALQSATEGVKIASEIVSGQFRYYDGSTWHDQWTSLDRKSAPSAIEVVFYSLPPAEANRWRSLVPGTREPEPWKEVVNIPSVSQGFSESYQRTQPPRPPQENMPLPSPPSSPQPQPPQPPSPFHSLFGDE